MYNIMILHYYNNLDLEHLIDLLEVLDFVFDITLVHQFFSFSLSLSLSLALSLSLFIHLYLGKKAATVRSKPGQGKKNILKRTLARNIRRDGKNIFFMDR